MRNRTSEVFYFKALKLDKMYKAEHIDNKTA